MVSLEQYEIEHAIYGRRAVREYTGRPVERDVVEQLLRDAVAAPSAMNRQPWAFAVVEGAERLRGFSEEAKAHLLASVPPNSEFAHLLGPDANIFHGAPALIVICASDDLPQSAEDCSLAAENLMLSAFTRGLGTCPIGFARAWLSLEPVKAKLGIPKEIVPVFPVVVGYPAAWPPSHGRRAPSIVSWLR